MKLTPHLTALEGGRIKRQRKVIALKRRLNEIMSKHTGQSFETIERDLERDNFMSAKAAVEYGLIDTVLASRTEMSAGKEG